MLALNTTVFTGAAALCAALSIMAVSPACADDIEASSLTVQLQGLDLNAPPDQSILRHRLRVASSKVCADGTHGGLNDNAFLECQTTAFNHAWSEAAMLMAAAKGRSLMAAKLAPASVVSKTAVALAVAPAVLPAR